MIKKLISSFAAFVMLATLILAIPVSAAGVPDELKTDYVAGSDGNLIDTIPAGVEINCGELPVSVSGNIATLTANGLIGSSSDWGMNGFHINKSFISTLPEGALSEGPVLTQGTKVLFSVKVRKAADATQNAKINLAYSSWYNVQYEGGSSIYTDNYPNVGDGFLVDSTEWTEFKAVMTAPKDCGGNEWSMAFGFSSGTAQGAKVEVDLSTMYLGTESAHDIDVTATPTKVSVGSSATVKATILNQVDDKFSGAQGGFSWYALSDDRESFADGITVTNNGNGTATVNVAQNVASGTYDIVAKSDTYNRFIKGVQITVAPISDYVPVDNSNLIDTIPAGVEINCGELPVSVSGNIATLTANGLIGSSSDWGMNGFHINKSFISTLPEGALSEGPVLTQGTKVLFSVKVRKAADATQNAKINLAYSSWYNVQYEGGSSIYTDNYPNVGDGFLVDSTEWTEFKAVMTAPKDCGGNEWSMAFGFSSGTAQGAKVEVDLSSMHLGVESAYDITVVNNGAKEFLKGTGGTFAVEADIVNRIGEVYSGAQGDFEWYAYNGDRTAKCENITITKGANGTAQVTVSPETAGGEYDIIAISDTYDGFVRGTTINVVELADYVPGEMPQNLISDVATALNANINSTQIHYSLTDDYVVLTANSDLTDSGTTWPYHGLALSRDGLTKTNLAAGTNIVFSTQVKYLTSGQNVTVSAGFYDPRTTPLYSNEYPTDADGMSVDMKGWRKFAASYTIREDFTYDEWIQPVIGMTEGTPAGTEFAISTEADSLYLGVETAYDINIKPVDTSVVEAGKDSTVTYKAQIVNQVGIPGALTQGTFTWYVMNEDKTDFTDDVKLIANADGTATINVSEDTPIGIYKIVAKSNLYSDYIRSYPLVVTDGSIKHSIYVSPEGNDNGDGSLLSPLKTVEAAQKLARQYIAENRQPLEVVFRGGNYYFYETLEFGAEDSGLDGYPVTYRAYENEAVKFKGSKSIDLTKASKVTETSILARIRDDYKSKVRVIDLEEQGILPSQICTPAETTNTFKLDYNREFNGFYINGKSMDVSCWPNGGDEATYTFNENDSVNKFTYTDTAPDRWGSAKNWWVTIFNMYDYIPLRLKVASVDTANNVIYTGISAGNVNTTIANPYTPTWKAYNLLEEIDVPGEYYIDIENMKLYFLPPCSLEGATAELDVIGNPVITLQDAKNITFQGIEFSQINDDGIVMTDVDNIDIVGCTFRDIGFRGVAVLGTEAPKTVQYATGDKFPYGDAVGEVSTANDASYNVDIKDNIFYNIGSSAIHINGGNIDTLTPSNNVVENNFINKFSQHVYWDGVVVVGVGTKVRHNNISNSPYYGIRIYGNDHVIEYNEIYDVIKNSNDAGAIYVGASPIARGSVIQYNYIHDIKTCKETKNDWEIGIYLDDCQQGITVQNNIIKDVHEGIWSNGAGDYTIDANTIINATTGIRFGYNAEAIPGSSARTEVANRIYNKDIYYAKYPALEDYVNGTSPKTSSQANANIFCNVGTNMAYYRSSWFTGNIDTCTKSLSQDKNATHNGNNTVSSNIFVNPNNQDYRVNSTNAATYYYPTNVNNTPDINVIGMTANLTLNAETAPFGVSYPANKATAIATDGLWLSWEDAFGSGKYRVTVAKNAAFTNPVYDEIVPYSAINLSDAITLNEDTTYYWKVTAINPSRDFGAEWQGVSGSFTTVGTSIENMMLEGSTVTADIYTYGDTISGSVEAVCYIASYDENNKLIEVVPQEITLEVGKKYSFNETFEHFVKENTYSVRMYVWTKGYIPVTDIATYVIPKKEQ